METLASQPNASTDASRKPAAFAHLPDATKENVARMRDHAKVIENAEGKSSESERIDAWNALRDMALSGKLKGLSGEDKEISDAARGGDIAERANRLHNDLMAAKSEAGSKSGRFQATIDFYDAQSNDDQQLLFSAVLNQPGANGEQRYASVDQWRQVFESEIQLADTVQRARDEEGYSSGQQIDDPKLAEAVRLAGASHMTDNEAWLAQVRDLFGVSQPVQDKVNLSLDAQKAMGPAPGDTDLALLQSTQTARIDQKA